MKLVNSFDAGQADGTVISTANSGGGTGNNAFDNVAGSPPYESTQKHSGTQSMQITSGALRQTEWTTASMGSGLTHIYGRAYFWPTTSTGVRIMQVDGNVTSDLFRIAMKATTGTLTININGSGTTNGTVAMNQSSWCRVEYEAQITGGNGLLTVKLFNTPDSTTPDETLGPITVALASDTSFASVRYGVGSSVATNWFMDDLEVNDTGYPGPLSSGTTIILGEAVSTPAAYGPVLSPGTATVILGEAVSSPVAHGPTLAPGAVTVIMGEAVSTPQAFGIVFVPTISLGIATSTPHALGADLSPGVATVVLGVAQSTPVAHGPVLAPGAVTLVVGKAASIAQALGVDLVSLIPASPYSDPWNKIQPDSSLNFAALSVEQVNQILLNSSVNVAQVITSGPNTIIVIEEV